ncbi:MAG: hypothetical protein ACPIOQ_27000 [Promethearchaeia archaeon]
MCFAHATLTGSGKSSFNAKVSSIRARISALRHEASATASPPAHCTRHCPAGAEASTSPQSSAEREGPQHPDTVPASRSGGMSQDDCAGHTGGGAGLVQRAVRLKTGNPAGCPQRSLH